MVPDFVWQLSTAKDDGPHPFASPRPLKTPHPACFGPETRDCIDDFPRQQRGFLADWVAPGWCGLAMLLRQPDWCV